MKIFVQSSVFLPTPSPGAGAVEYLVAKLTQGLAGRGHDVTLFALGGSDVPGVKLITVEPQGSPAAREAGLVMHMTAEAVSAYPDVLFDHSLTQLAQKVFGPDLPAVSMSHGMAPLSPWARNPAFTSRHHSRLHGRPEAQVLYNGVDVDAIPLGPPARDRQQRLVWAGRILPYKRPHVGLDWAWESHRPLVLAGPIVDADYFRREVEPRVRRAHPLAEYRGELSHDALLALFRDSAALIFTSDESEPFGIVMLEAMASGCPVLAYDAGANPEILLADVGRLVQNDEEAVQLLREGFWPASPPILCRNIVSQHFGMDHMVESAEALLTRAVAEVLT